MPPVGKLDASGSPRTSSLPENSVIAVPSESGPKNESCFSAVAPVKRLEPVGVVARAALHRPLAHRGGDAVGQLHVERLAPLEGALEVRVDGLGQVGALRGGLKTLAPKISLTGELKSLPWPLGLHWDAARLRWAAVDKSGAPSPVGTR